MNDLTIHIKISADETLTGLMRELARAFGGETKTAAAINQPSATPQPTVPQTAPAASVTPPVSVTPQAPAVPAPTTSAIPYSLEQLALAAAPLMDAGKANELTELMKSFGVASLQQLPTDRYGEFAAAIRTMGARI